MIVAAALDVPTGVAWAPRLCGFTDKGTGEAPVPRRRRASVLTLTLLLLLTANLAQAQTTRAAPATRPVNERCPVTTDEASSPLHEITFRGAAVRFCCRQCKDRFLLEPQAYLAGLPHVPAEAPAAAAAKPRDKGWFDVDFWRLLRTAERFVEAWQPFMIALAVVGLVHVVAGRHSRARKQRADASSPAPSPAAKPRVVSRLIDVLGRTSTLLIAVLAIVLLGQWWRQRTSPPPGPVAMAPSHVHETAARFMADMARQGILQGPEFVSLTEKTYYRGNDERSPELYNGGVYRTCTFHVSLHSEDGRPVVAGQKVGGQRLFVRVEIRRASGALASHFTDAGMTNSSLVPRGVTPDVRAADDATGKAVHPFVVVEPGTRWAAGCPIGTPTSDTGVQHFNGMILLPPRAEGTADHLWSEAHYGIQYSLRIEKGVLTPSSKLWMGALLWTEDLPDHRLHEWLSWRPLPEMPAGFRHVSETN
jgi:hypothetical protein